MKILVMGLSQSGKTTLYKDLLPLLDAVHIENNAVRDLFQDWDFTHEGRIRQARRMAMLCDSVDYKPHVLADFICPTEETRQIFGPDFTVWLNTIPPEKYPFADTNALFEQPQDADFEVSAWEAGNARKIAAAIAHMATAKRRQIK